MHLYSHCAELYPGDESGKWSDVLSAFTAYKGPVDRLLGGADLAVLLTSDSEDLGEKSLPDTIVFLALGTYE